MAWPDNAPGGEVEPDPALASPEPWRHLADGSHAGLRWWVQRAPGGIHLTVTANGHDGGRYISETAELPGATTGTVRAWVEGVLTRAKAAQERRRGR